MKKTIFLSGIPSNFLSFFVWKLRGKIPLFCLTYSHRLKSLIISDLHSFLCVVRLWFLKGLDFTSLASCSIIDHFIEIGITMAFKTLLLGLSPNLSTGSVGIYCWVIEGIKVKYKIRHLQIFNILLRLLLFDQYMCIF